MGAGLPITHQGIWSHLERCHVPDLGPAQTRHPGCGIGPCLAVHPPAQLGLMVSLKCQAGPGLAPLPGRIDGGICLREGFITAIKQPRVCWAGAARDCSCSHR